MVACCESVRQGCREARRGKVADRGTASSTAPALLSQARAARILASPKGRGLAPAVATRADEATMAITQGIACCRDLYLTMHAGGPRGEGRHVPHWQLAWLIVNLVPGDPEASDAELEIALDRLLDVGLG